MTRVFLCFFLILATRLLAQPVDNPYRSLYPATPGGHFTDSLRWGQVFDYSTLNLHPSPDTNVTQAMALVSASGGGVLFFPAGTYTFSQNLVVPSGVVLRGEASLVNSAKDSSFSPLTRFVFPEYIPSFSGNGTPNSTAFKTISCGTNSGNLGLVNLDINHARIVFSPGSRPENRNILVLSVRQNNATAPSTQVPDGNGQHGWQRFCDRFASNITVYGYANGIVANCRFNDFENNRVHPIPDASYDQPNYLANSANGYVTPPLPDLTRFSYTDHYVIRLGRVGGAVYGEPNTAPGLFRTGFEARDNWLYKTMRVGIYAAGTGLKIIGNVLRDKPGKLVWLRPEGMALTTNFSATYENRGIDFSGWKIECDSNDIEVYRHNFVNSSYQTVDGEGILVQECCGGTSVNDYQINYNSLTGTSAYIGIFKMRDIHNLRIIGNNLNNQSNILVLADVNGCSAANLGSCYTMSNVTIADNYNLGHNCQFGAGEGIGLNASRGGGNVFIVNNIARPGGFRECNRNIDTLNINRPCWAWLNTDPTQPLRNTNTNLKSTGCSQPFASISLPNPVLVQPANGATFTPQTAITLEVNPGSAQVVDTLEYWLDATLLYKQALGDPSFGTYVWNAPAGAYREFIVSVKARNVANRVYAWTAAHRVRLSDPTALPTVARPKSLRLYPVPAQSELFWESTGTSIPPSWQVLDLQGRVLRSGQESPAQIEGLASGTYLFRLGSLTKLWVKR